MQCYFNSSRCARGYGVGIRLMVLRRGRTSLKLNRTIFLWGECAVTALVICRSCCTMCATFMRSCPFTNTTVRNRVRYRRNMSACTASDITKV